MHRSLIVAAAALSQWVAGAAHAVTYFVAPCGQDFWTGVDVNCAGPNGPKRTIQAAINAASSGDTIRVMPGVYFETIDYDGKELTIESLVGPATTIIDGNGDGPVVLCNSFEGPGTTLRGFTIRNGFNDDTNGAGMVVALATVAVEECIFADNETGPPAAGAGIASLSGILTVTDCQFLNNTGWSAGGMLVWGGNATVTNCTFDGNDGGNRGGGMYIYQADVEITDSEFINGFVGSWDASGAGLYIEEANVTMDGCTISDNFPFRGTAGVHAVAGSELTLNNCDFDNNQAETPQAYGNALYLDESSASLIGCSLTNNSGGDAGGAVYAMESELSATLCGFNDNSGSTAGAIYLAASTFEAALCTIGGNEAVNAGGAIAASAESEIVLEGCTISNNTATSGFGSSGAIRMWDGSLTATSCIFSSNTGKIDGAINLTGNASAIFESCTFDNNESLTGDGGAIRALDSSVLVKGGSFESNAAANLGGAIYVEGINSELAITGASFNANTAASAGGAISTTSPTLIIGCGFTGNAAQDAGALAMGTAFGDTRIYNSRFTGNSATQAGGAIFAGAFSAGASVDIVNCIVDNNTCPFGGGAIHESALGAHVRIFNSSIVNNTGGGYRVADGGTTSEVANSIVWGNTQGGGVAGNMPLVRFSNVQGGVIGPTSMSVNPQFVNAAAGDFRLAARSPCIDAGHNWLLPHDLADLDGDGDTMELVPFDFAGSDRVMDDPSAFADTCNAGPAAVDMGPYETAGAALEPIRLGDVVDSGTFAPPPDGVVDGADLAVLLGAWGDCADEMCCPLDLDLNGQIDGWDLALLLGSWG